MRQTNMHTSLLHLPHSRHRIIRSIHIRVQAHRLPMRTPRRNRNLPIQQFPTIRVSSTTTANGTYRLCAQSLPRISHSPVSIRQQQMRFPGMCPGAWITHRDPSPKKSNAFSKAPNFCQGPVCSENFSVLCLGSKKWPSHVDSGSEV